MLKSAVRFLVVLILASGMFVQLSALAGAQDEMSSDTTETVDGDGSAEIFQAEPIGYVYTHVRECPADAVDAYTDCHPQGIPGITVEVFTDGETELYSCVTDAEGNCVVSVYGTGPYYGWDYTDATLINVYCTYESEIGTETYIDLSTGMYFDPSMPGTVIYCDVYRLGDGTGADSGSGDGADDGVGGGDLEITTSGVGPIDGRGSEVLAVLAAAGIAGLSFALRRRALR